MYKYNRFIPVINAGDKNYLFCVNGYINAKVQNKEFKLSDNEEKHLFDLINGKEFDKDELTQCFTPILLQYMLKNNIITQSIIDYESIYSRNIAAFKAMNLDGAYKQLENKCVVILGCGGLGTHLAWNMITLGVKNLYLLDYDKVEKSNLNRQILYTQLDVGMKKTQVLKTRLLDVNPEANIICLEKKIEKKVELNNILMRIEPRVDLVIKALDTPEDISFWVDEVCKELKIAYLNGFIMDGKMAIGPTYIPQVSKSGISELMSHNMEKSYGLSGSLAIQFYHISAEMAQEAAKVLLNCGNLKYLDKIVLEDIWTGEKVQVTHNMPQINGWIIVLLLMILQFVGKRNPIISILFLLISAIFPMIVYKELDMAYKMAFVSVSLIFIENIYLNFPFLISVFGIQLIPFWMLIFLSLNIALTVIVAFSFNQIIRSRNSSIKS